MKHSITKPCFRFILLMVPLLFSGCGVLILGGAAAGTVGYVNGDMNATLENKFDQVVRATDQMIKDNSIIESSKDVSRYKIDYVLRTHQKDKIELNITYATRDLTHITIRVNPFGDESLSYQILNQIKTGLK